MTFLKYLKIFILSLYWKLPQAKEIDFTAQMEVVWTAKRKQVKKRKLRRTRPDLPPIRRQILAHQRYRGVKPKDPRFSNQRKLRRMFRGV